MNKILKKIFLTYCAITLGAFGIGYTIIGLGSLGLIPPPPTEWKDK